MTLKPSIGPLRNIRNALQVVDAVKAPRKQNGAPVFQALFLLREVSTKQVRAPAHLVTPLRITVGLTKPMSLFPLP